MIDSALILLREELNEYIRSTPGNTDPSYVVLGNVAALDNDGSDELRSTLVITLVNIEEESTLKNGKTFQKMPNGTVRYENPSIFLNLYILFSANFPDNYTNALIRLSQTIRFFQGKQAFNTRNTVSPTLLAALGDPTNPDKDALAGLELYLDLYTMTFEQINHLWGSLGGKQIPFVMYKGRLVAIREPKYRAEAPVIEEIGMDSRSTKDNP